LLWGEFERILFLLVLLLKVLVGFALIVVRLGFGLVCGTMLYRLWGPSLSVRVLLFREVRRNAEEGALQKLCVDDGVW
jgi:hypothetical protein